MEEIGKKRLAAAGVVVAGLVYFLVCASPLQKELILVPVWTRSVSQAPAAPTSKKGDSPCRAALSGAASSAPIPFRLGDRYGYFTADGSILFAAPLSYGVAMAQRCLRALRSPLRRLHHRVARRGEPRTRVLASAILSSPRVGAS